MRHPCEKPSVTSPISATAEVIRSEGRPVELASLPPEVAGRIPENTETLVQINAAAQIGGGILLATGKFPRVASVVLAGTLIPTTAAGTDFWNEAERLTQAADGDGILMYMQLMLHHARQNGAPVTRETLRDHGREVALFEGLKDLSWFERMNAFGARYDLDIEHYIVSAGLEEMIEGTPIRPALTHVFASHYVYDDKGEAAWPAVGVNYTTKTQYLFRINKGVKNHWEHERINHFIPDDERAVPFDRIDRDALARADEAFAALLPG